MVLPKLRLPGFEGEWASVRMDKVFSEIVEKGQTDLPVLSVRQGYGTVLRDESDRNIQYDKTNLKNYKVIHKNDFIIHLRSFEGGLECANHDGISSPAYKILRSNMLNPELYCHYFRSYKFIEGKLGPAVIGIRDGRNIEMTTFWQTKLNVPSMEEQNAMAEVIRSVDDVITNLTEEVRLWEEKKKGVMQKIFSQEVRFKDEKGEDYPEWEEKFLNEEADFLPGLTYKPDDVSNSGILVLRSSNVQNGLITYEDNVYVSISVPKRISTQRGDILMCVRNGSKKLVGKCAVITEKDENHAWGAFMTVIRSHSNNSYVYHFVSSDLFRNQIFRDAGTGTISQITFGMLRECKINIPCVEEQEKIAECLSSIDNVISIKKQKLETWKTIKKGLLQQMFV